MNKNKKDDTKTIMVLPYISPSKNSNGDTLTVITTRNVRKSKSLLLVTAVSWKNGYLKAMNLSTLSVNNDEVENPFKVLVVTRLTFRINHLSS